MLSWETLPTPAHGHASSPHALPSAQERQRLETILNLCAEYSRADGGPEAGELPSIGEAAAALALAGRRPSRGFPGASGAPGRSSEEPGGAPARLWESLDRSEEENLKEECSSTESTQQEVGVGGREHEQEVWLGWTPPWSTSRRWVWGAGSSSRRWGAGWARGRASRHLWWVPRPREGGSN